jgi:hypothetical protein
VGAGLSERDLAVVRDVARLRLVTGKQLERLHFMDLDQPSRSVVRRRVLGRLVRLGLLGTLTRRIGGVRAGSDGLVFAIDTKGQRLLGQRGRATRPRTPGMLFVHHVLGVAELYVALVERTRAEEHIRLAHFAAEPASWWPDGRGGRLKPDAYIRLANLDYEDHWWLELDRATESLPVLKRKLAAYSVFWQSGQLGPNNIVPRVLVTVPDTKRFSGLVRLIRQLPEGAEKLFIVATDKDVIDVVMRCLNQSD